MPNSPVTPSSAKGTGCTHTRESRSLPGILAQRHADVVYYVRVSWHSRVAQLAEQRTVNPRVVGSSPTSGANLLFAIFLSSGRFTGRQRLRWRFSRVCERESSLRERFESLTLELPAHHAAVSSLRNRHFLSAALSERKFRVNNSRSESVLLI